MILATALAAAAFAGADGVEAAVREAGFGPRLARRAAAAALPAIRPSRRVLDRAPRRRGTSRLGGAPDLPRGTRWPHCRGEPQSFLGQIRLADLPAAGQELRRHRGRLLFFTHVQFERGERRYGLWAGRCTSVIHAREGAKLRRRARPPGTLKVRPAALRFRTRPDLPDTDDDSRLYPPLSDVEIGDAWERWFELRFALLYPGQGYGSEHKLLGYLESPNGGPARCWQRALRRRGTWRHLFTMGPDFGVGFEVADAGRLQILVGPGDLRRGRFGRACGIFDSG